MVGGPLRKRPVTNALPNLPHVDGVFAQGGGDAYGILQAFLQSPDYEGDIPAISGGNSTDFVKWWREANEKSGVFDDFGSPLIRASAKPHSGSRSIFWRGPSPNSSRRILLRF